jgi:hypothetical protein
VEEASSGDTVEEGEVLWHDEAKRGAATQCNATEVKRRKRVRTA